MPGPISSLDGPECFQTTEDAFHIKMSRDAATDDFSLSMEDRNLLHSSSTAESSSPILIIPSVDIEFPFPLDSSSANHKSTCSN